MLLLRRTQKRQQKSPHSREHTQLLKMVQVQFPAHVGQLTTISNSSSREFSLLFCVLQTCGGHTYTCMNIKPERKKGKKNKDGIQTNTKTWEDNMAFKVFVLQMQGHVFNL